MLSVTSLRIRKDSAKLQWKKGYASVLVDVALDFGLSNI